MNWWSVLCSLRDVFLIRVAPLHPYTRRQILYTTGFNVRLTKCVHWYRKKTLLLDEEEKFVSKERFEWWTRSIFLDIKGREREAGKSERRGQRRSEKKEKIIQAFLSLSVWHYPLSIQWHLKQFNWNGSMTIHIFYDIRLLF
jgi:hypothetical protein